MKNILALLITVFLFKLSYSQDSLKCYISTKHFIQKKEYNEILKPKITAEGEDFYRIPKMVNLLNKKDKKASLSWAIYYKDNYWVNMRYSNDYYNNEVYVKFEIVGRYCVIVINSDTENFIKNRGKNYGLGIEGVLVKELDKWDKNWEDSNENMNKILIFDTSTTYLVDLHGRYCSVGKLLTQKNINQILNQNFEKEKIKSLKFEEVIEIIKNENSKNQETLK